MYEDVSIAPAMVAAAAEPAEEAPEAMLPETGAATTPWLAIGFVGGGILVLLSALFLTYRRQSQGASIED